MRKICWVLDATQQFVREPRRNIYKYITNICKKDAKMTNSTTKNNTKN